MMLRACLLSIFPLAAAIQAHAGLPAKVETPWSFAPLRRPAVPQVRQADWPRDDLDRFVLARLEATGLEPSTAADRATLIRRLTLDLHGLLPSLAEVEAFEKDKRTDDAAVADVVDRLLKSPRFGERWARHWLDVVRYADSTGRSWNAPLIYAFRYRDWVIDSLNADKPYTRFMAEQVAGDLLPARSDAERADALIGTGMLGLGSMDLTQGEYERYRMDLVDDQIDVTTRAFLGLTIACARCHDHKTDPITQHDYYALAGLFYSTRTLAGTADRSNLGANLYVDPEHLVTLPQHGSAPPDQTRAGEVNLFDSARPDPAAAMGMEQRDGKGYRIAYARDPALAMGVAEERAQNCPIRKAGDPYDEGATPQRGDLRIPRLPPFPKVGSGASGRAEFAQWLSTATHPLTSRVMVNRVWSHLFGRGLVTTADNFGLTGAEPDHVELLDHLAVRFVVDGWSVKKLIRTICMSRTYRQSSESFDGAASRDKDPGNVMLWRKSPRRMELEALRDSMLQLAGDLTFDRPAGIPISGNGGKGNTGRTRSLLGFDDPYRTIYLPVLRDLLPESYATWDFPNPSQIQGQREVTTVASQALFMMNDRFASRAADGLAGQTSSLPDDRARIDAIYRTLFARHPDAEEITAAQDLLGSLSDAQAAWSTLVQALIGSAEFRYVW